MNKKTTKTGAALEPVDVSIILWLNARAENGGDGATLGDMRAGITWHAPDEIRASVTRLSRQKLIWATRPGRGRKAKFSLAHTVPPNMTDVIRET